MKQASSASRHVQAAFAPRQLLCCMCKRSFKYGDSYLIKNRCSYCDLPWQGEPIVTKNPELPIVSSRAVQKWDLTRSVSRKCEAGFERENSGTGNSQSGFRYDWWSVWDPIRVFPQNLHKEHRRRGCGLVRLLSIFRRALQHTAVSVIRSPTDFFNCSVRELRGTTDV